MADDMDDWELIPDFLDGDIHTLRGFVPPSAKASQTIPPSSLQVFPRSPAVLQVPSSLQPSASSSGPGTPALSSFSGCSQTVHDLKVFPQRCFGHHRSAPYQLADLNPGVHTCPTRIGYQPQSFQQHETPPPPLVTDGFAKPFTDELPPAPLIFAGSSDKKVFKSSQQLHRRGGSTSQQSQLVRLRKPSDSEMIINKFDALLNEFGSESDVFQALSQSQFPDAHRNRLLDAYAASTVFRYLQAVQQFSTTLKTLGFSLPELSVPQLVDCLAAMSHAKSMTSDSMSGNFTLKALRWFRKIAGVSSLAIAYSPLADSFLKVRLTSDKKEAPPLPLWILFHWERRILYSQSTIFEVIMLGSYLFMAWSSIRFSDAQRLNVESLVLTDQVLRGMVWRSKTRSNGHPFGIVSSGICSTGSFTWLVKFLRTWDTLLADASISTGDFLIPDLSEDGKWLSHEPLDYASALKIFRRFLQTPWKSFSGKHPLEDMQLNYTLHSLKATLLSFGPQLGSAVDPDDRLQQGHHADPRKSLHLYGRDSVWGSLRYQQTVVSKIREGFRPKTAQHRGGQSPLVEPPVVVELFKKQASEYTYRWLPFSQQQVSTEIMDERLEEDSSTSSSSSSASSSKSVADKGNQRSSGASVKQPKQLEPVDEVILAKHRRVTHAMVVSPNPGSGFPQHQGQSWKPACGTHMSHGETVFLDEWSNNLSFCQHPGCKRAWAVSGMF